MKHSLSLNDGKIVYEFDDQATWEKDGKTFEFVSLKKVTTFKESKKFQNLTCKVEDWPEVKKFLAECLVGKDGDDTDSVPF